MPLLETETSPAFLRGTPQLGHLPDSFDLCPQLGQVYVTTFVVSELS